MKILVTGGTGFVGRALIPRLIQSSHDVVATSRDVNAEIAGATVYPISELGPDTDWHEALRGVEAVIHLAARVHVMSDNAPDSVAENRRVNTEGTGKLAKDAAMAEEAEVQRLLQEVCIHPPCAISLVACAQR